MGTVPMEQPSGLVMWVSQNGQIVFFFAQLAYWLIIAGAVIFAVIQAKRFVDNACGLSATANPADTSDVFESKDDEVEVEKFVE